jgi:hypothetical protein
VRLTIATPDHSTLLGPLMSAESQLQGQLAGQPEPPEFGFENGYH